MERVDTFPQGLPRVRFRLLAAFTLLLLALGSLASLLVALLFYAAVERPFMRVKARRALSHEQ